MRHPRRFALGRPAVGAAVLFIAASCAAGTTQPPVTPPAAIAASVSPAPGGQSPSAPSTADAPSPSGAIPSALSTRTVNIVAIGSSGVSGTATLSDIGGGRTMVVIKVDANYNLDMPSMIAGGPCSHIDETTVWSLADTRGGVGT